MDLTLGHVMRINRIRADKWHDGSIHNWTSLEWAGAMCGEAGEAANAAKKLKRVIDNLKTINEGARHLPDIASAQTAVTKEVCDTILYALLLANSVGCMPEEFEKVFREVFNKKSEEYGFDERL